MNGYTMDKYNQTPKGWDYTNVLVGLLHTTLNRCVLCLFAPVESLHLRIQQCRAL